jgi:hypothetical protein
MSADDRAHLAHCNPVSRIPVSSDVDRVGQFIVGAGLVIEAFGEPYAGIEVAKANPALEGTLIAPLFLHIRRSNRAGRRLVRTVPRLAPKEQNPGGGHWVSGIGGVQARRSVRFRYRKSFEGKRDISG